VNKDQINFGWLTWSHVKFGAVSIGRHVMSDDLSDRIRDSAAFRISEWMPKIREKRHVCGRQTHFRGALGRVVQNLLLRALDVLPCVRLKDFGNFRTHHLAA
jgi:hypothetical protein